MEHDKQAEKMKNFIQKILDESPKTAAEIYQDAGIPRSSWCRYLQDPDSIPFTRAISICRVSDIEPNKLIAILLNN